MKLVAKCARCGVDVDITWKIANARGDAKMYVMCKSCSGAEPPPDNGESTTVGLELSEDGDLQVTVTKKF